jgi:ABC-type polysaccharide/polyol phosphate export permease
MNPIKSILVPAWSFLQQIVQHRHVLASLTRRDFERKYIKNILGMVWAVLDPFAFVVILYFVFGSRFGNKTADGVPFVTFLLCGYIAYDLFSNIQQLTMVVKDYSFLLKKVEFKVALLPIVRVNSGLLVHAVVLLVTVVILLFNGVYPNWYWFQLLYYIMALSVFLVGTAWFTSSVYLFFPDIGNIISIVIRILFFFTPIFWTLNGLSPKMAFVLKLNPLFYIVQGYRDSLLYHRGFWEMPDLTLYYWALTLGMLLLGMVVFKKLRPHFADVTD